MPEISDRPSVAEQYLRSTVSTDLRMRELPCDADKLLAAAYAQGRDRDRQLALVLWRMRATGQTYDYKRVVDLFNARLHSNLNRRGKRARNTRPTVEKALWWWLHPTCKSCDGLGHPKIDGTPVLDESIQCAACDGTGQSDWRTLIREDEHKTAAYVIDLLDSYSAMVFADMAKLLR